MNRISLPGFIKILATLKENKNMPLNKVAHKIDMTYSHVLNTTNDMIKRGWLKVEKIGRKNEYTFTKSGDHVAELCIALIKEIDK